MRLPEGLTKEQESLAHHNWYLTKKLLGVQKGYVLHHIDPTLKYTDPERYIEWRPEDVVVLTRGEHTIIHHKGKVTSMETRKRMSEANTRPFAGWHWKVVDGKRV